eukprot:6840462-Ditylum_brightwellii.AAC.1
MEEAGEEDLMDQAIEEDKAGTDLRRNLELNSDVVISKEEDEKTEVEEKAVSITKVVTEEKKTEAKEKS